MQVKLSLYSLPATPNKKIASHHKVTSYADFGRIWWKLRRRKGNAATTQSGKLLMTTISRCKASSPNLTVIFPFLPRGTAWRDTVHVSLTRKVCPSMNAFLLQKITCVYHIVQHSQLHRLAGRFFYDLARLTIYSNIRISIIIIISVHTVFLSLKVFILCVFCYKMSTCDISIMSSYDRWLIMIRV